MPEVRSSEGNFAKNWKGALMDYVFSTVNIELFEQNNYNALLSFDYDVR